MVGLAVSSHYLLDVLVHVPDLPLMGNDSTKLGLGLWNNPVATLAAEALVFGAGLALYAARGSHRHPVRAGRILLLVLLLVGAYLAGTYGAPVPPNMTTVAVSAIVFILAMGGLAGWADRRTTSEELAALGLSHR
jgi:hypothetical protein